MNDFEAFAARFVAFDTETHQFQKGLAAPPLVCGSKASVEEPEGAFLVSSAFLVSTLNDNALAEQTVSQVFRKLLESNRVIVGANIAYDMAVMAAEAYRESVEVGDEVLAAIYAKYDRDEVFDVQLAEALNAIAGGHLGKDHRTMQDLTDPVTGKRGRYNLSIVTDLVLGRDDAKKNDFWRRRYAILERVPVEHWPVEATEYPKDDARNALEIATVQASGRDVFDHEWEGYKCKVCGVEVSFGVQAPCTRKRRTEPHRNLQCMPDQARAAFALALASTWGLRTDPEAVDLVEAEALDCTRMNKKHDPSGNCCRVAGTKRWAERGFVLEGEGKSGGDKQVRGVYKTRLARAYGAKSPCPVCNGSGKVKSAKSKSEVICNAKNVAGRFDGTPCDGTGLDLREAPLLALTAPTDKGGGCGIKAGRDDLAESGDEELMAFAEYQEDDKLFGTYLPALRLGTKVPMTPKANPILASGRTSYDGVIQLIPREGRERNCFVPRKGYVYCSTDYSSGELCTFAQVLLWTVGRSRMAEIINESKDPGALHTHFGARMAGRSPDEFKALVKEGDKRAKDFRQAAKAFNFGLGGGMGEVTFSIAKRKKSEGFTLSPHGFNVNAKGERGYNGIRFCILIGGAERCGTEMITEWRGRPTRAPVCRHCVEVVRQLKGEWLAFFDEVPRYFEIVSANVDATGELCTCPCGMVRGGLSFTDGANNGFQHLLSCGAKRAKWLTSREMYTVKDSPLYGSRIDAFFHDELFSEMPEWIAPEAGVRQAELMVQGLKEYVPDVHVACEPALMRRWNKAAEPVWVEENGVKHLAVWEPRST